MLVGIIRQGNSEASGYTYNKKFWSRTGYKIKRWFFPHYKRVAHIVETAKFFQRQLHRYRLVDQLIVSNALSQATELRLTEKELSSVVDLVLDSPKEIEDIEKLVQKIYHGKFGIGQFIPEGEFDIDGIYKRIKKENLGELMRNYDDATLHALNNLGHVLSNAKERSGQRKRTTNDYDTTELRLFFGAYNRGMDRNEKDYDHWVNKSSNESYSVERKNRRMVPSGTDKNGRTTYKTEVYYTSATVTPDFNTLIHGGYDTGSRSVSGLSDIKERVSAMKNKELPYSNKIESHEDYIENVITNYTAALLKNEGNYREEILTKMKTIEEDISSLKIYQAWSDQQILAQYSKDNIEVFKNRNREMLERYENMHNIMNILSELLNRGELQFQVAFDLWDYSHWMSPMRDARTKNLIQKTALITPTVTGGVAYAVSPEFNYLVDGWVHNAATYVEHIIKLYSPQ